MNLVFNSVALVALQRVAHWGSLGSGLDLQLNVVG